MDDTSSAKPITHIAEGTTVNAHIKTSKSIRISGVVDGEIESDQKIILAVSGRLKGKFTAEINANIYSGDGTDVLKAQKKSSAKTTAPSKPKKEEKAEDEESTKPSPKPDTPPPSRFVGNVLIGIPEADLDEKITNEIKDACQEFMESIGFSLEIFDEAVYNPFFQSLTYVRKSHEEEKEITQRYEDGKAALESSFLKKEENEQKEELNRAAKKLTKAIGQVDEIAIALGKIILVQVIDENVQTVAAEMISPKLTTDLKESPKLVLKPNEVYSRLSS